MSRLAAAWKAFWSILRSPEMALRWDEFRRGPPAPAVAAAPAPPPPSAAPGSAATPGDAVFTLVLLQREGRLIDFLQEPLDGFTDAQVGAAARQIHDDCRRALQQVFGIAPVRSEPEGSSVSLPAGFDPRQVRLSGTASGTPPYAGTLRHRGWRATRADLPQRHPSLDPMLICAAEVEVGR